MNLPIRQGKAYVYNSSEIQRRASKSYRTHQSKSLSLIYKVAKLVTLPALKAIHNMFVLKRKGEYGPGGESKKYKLIQTIGLMSATLILLPLMILGILTQLALRPGRGNEKVRFMNASKQDYIPPVIGDDDPIHMATYNFAGLPTPVDAMKDVISSKKRAKELVEWINSQPMQDLPLFVGLQEAFDQDASEVICNGVKERYPYAVTNAGRSKIPFLGSNSGLQFHSRVPIKTAAFFPFQDLVGFGVKCSDRGVLRVELDLGNGKSALVYITHTQAHAEHHLLRENELKLIAAQMRIDRLNDLNEGLDRKSHYYMMGDLNVSNVDDESLKRIDEHKKLSKLGKILHSDHFYDPFIENNNGRFRFLEKDTRNQEREHKIPHGTGTFYKGADQIHRGEWGYGSKKFSKGPQKCVDDCRYDYILRLRFNRDYKLAAKTAPESSKGHVEFRNLLSDKLKRCPISDHKMVSGIFYRRKKNGVISK